MTFAMSSTLQTEMGPYVVRDANVRRLLQFLGLASLVAGSLLLLLFFDQAARAPTGQAGPPVALVLLSLPLFLVGAVATLLGTRRRRVQGDLA